MRRPMMIRHGNYGDAGGDASTHGLFRVYILKSTIIHTILVMFGTLAFLTMVILRHRVTAFDARATLVPRSCHVKLRSLQNNFIISLTDQTMLVNAERTAAMPAQRSLNLTLIVAATPKLGIGKGGQLPWPPHKSDMAFFARVTKRVPSSFSSDTANHTSDVSPLNAVIMGRKTWESIPPKFRPLKDRVNIVLTRSGVLEELDKLSEEKRKHVLVAENLDKALELLHQKSHDTDTPTADVPQTARAFVIGGSSIYAAALRLSQTKSVLLTKMYNDFECDTFFPIDLEGEEGRKQGWQRKSSEELEAFTGEEGLEGIKEEGSTKFEYCLFERD